jgi:dTDP-4-amino-4,6-dideoxygalactose transaminase
MLAIPGSRSAQYHACLRKDLDAAIARVIDRSVFTPSTEVRLFEEAFASFLGVRHAVAVSSGSMGLMLALLALGIEPGDEVIAPPNVDIAVSAPISNAGARLVWADIEPRTYNLDSRSVADAVTPHTRAIVVVHMYGNPVDMAAFGEISREYGIPLVEDASLAPGARYREQLVGSFGEIGCFSFSPGKPLDALGTAGMIVTSRGDLAARARCLSTYGFNMESIGAIQRVEVGARFHYEAEGYNARMDELQAAVLRVKLPHLDRRVTTRRDYAARYRTLLAGLEPDHLLLPEETPGATSAPRVFVIRCRQRDGLMAYLAEAGIWSGLQYVPPLHQQPLYASLGYEPGDLPQADTVARELLALPVYPELAVDEVERVAATIRDYFRQQ